MLPSFEVIGVAWVGPVEVNSLATDEDAGTMLAAGSWFLFGIVRFEWRLYLITSSHHHIIKPSRHHAIMP
jgi:hypothetical protein